MLTTLEVDEIQPVLESILALNGRIWLAPVLPDNAFMVELSKVVSELASAGIVAGAAITICIHRQWDDDPAWLLRLLNAIHSATQIGPHQNIPGLAKICQRIANKQNVLNDVWHARWVNKGRPFLAREPLRKSLSELAGRDGPSVLLVNGDPKTGKTYTSELLEYASAQQNGLKVVSIEIPPGGDEGMDALQLAILLVANLGFEIREMDLPHGISTNRISTNQSIMVLKAWVILKVQATGGLVWMVLDGFSQLPRENDAHKLIQALAEATAKQVAIGRRLHVVLVDYQEPLARVESDQLRIDTCAELCEADASVAVEACFDALFQELGKTPPPNMLNTVATELVRTVIAGHQKGSSLMHEMSLAVRSTANAMRDQLKRGAL